MRKPVPPASFTSKDPAALTDLKRLRDHCQDLLDWIDAAAPALAGDVTGDSDSNEVTSIQGKPVDDGLPGSTGDVVTWDGSKLALVTPSAGGSLAGDVTGALGSNLVSEIQGKTVEVGLPGSSGDVVTWDGAILKLSAPAASTTAVNPYVDLLAPVNALSDEFDSGSADLAARGWTVYDRATGATLTRSGGILFPNPVVGTGTYRSTRFGSRLIIQTEASGLIAAKAAPLNLDTCFAIRCGAPKGNLNTNSGSSTASLAGSWQFGIIRSQATLGTIPWRVSNNFQAVTLGGRSLANETIQYEQFAYGFNRDATDSYSTSVLSPADLLWACVTTSAKLEYIHALNAETGVVCGSLGLAAGGELAFSGGTGQIGFQLFHGNAGAGGGAASTFSLDYFRVWDGISWFNL